jgi:hypothetical protein
MRRARHFEIAGLVEKPFAIVRAGQLDGVLLIISSVARPVVSVGPGARRP